MLVLGLRAAELRSQASALGVVLQKQAFRSQQKVFQDPFIRNRVEKFRNKWYAAIYQNIIRTSQPLPLYSCLCRGPSRSALGVEFRGALGVGLGDGRG